MDVAHRLRDQGYRLTPQRRLVWEVLRRADRHLTAEEIHERVTETVPDFNLASVYRTLSLLSELELAKEVKLGGDRGHWEVAHPDDQFHLVCEGCGSVTHHSGDLVAQIRQHLDQGHDFCADEVSLVVHGRCTDCRAE